MITYRIDKQALADANTALREVAVKLNDMIDSLQSLQNTLGEHESAISSPTIKNFRDELLESVAEAVDLVSGISEQSQKLSGVSEQAGKHLAAIEEHFGASLRDRSSPAQAAIQ